MESNLYLRERKGVCILSSFLNELNDIRIQMANVANTNFDDIFEEMFDDFLVEQFTAIKDNIKTAVKQNPSLKTISHTILYAANVASKHTAYFDGSHKFSAKYYSIAPTTALPTSTYISMHNIRDFRSMSKDSAACCLVMDQLYHMEYRKGWLNKSYAMVLTPLGERFVSSMQELCKQNQICVSFDCYFNCWFKGNTITEAVSIGHSFSPRAIYEEDFNKFSLRLTAKIQF